MQRDRIPECDRLGDMESKAHALFKIGEILLESGGLSDGRTKEISDALRESFQIVTRLGFAEAVGSAGALYAQVLATAGYRDEAFAVLDQAEAAFAKLKRQFGLDHVRELRDLIRQMPARDDPPAADA